MPDESLRRRTTIEHVPSDPIFGIADQFAHARSTDEHTYVPLHRRKISKQEQKKYKRQGEAEEKKRPDLECPLVKPHEMISRSIDTPRAINHETRHPVQSQRPIGQDPAATVCTHWSYGCTCIQDASGCMDVPDNTSLPCSTFSCT